MLPEAGGCVDCWGILDGKMGWLFSRGALDHRELGTRFQGLRQDRQPLYYLVSLQRKLQNHPEPGVSLGHPPPPWIRDVRGPVAQHEDLTRCRAHPH